jgi:hypothetical protein
MQHYRNPPTPPCMVLPRSLLDVGQIRMIEFRIFIHVRYI